MSMYAEAMCCIVYLFIYLFIRFFFQLIEHVTQ